MDIKIEDEIENPRQMEHLGDGLCVDFNGESIRLFTPREDGIHEVFLDVATFSLLLDYVERVGFGVSRKAVS